MEGFPFVLLPALKSQPLLQDCLGQIRTLLDWETKLKACSPKLLLRYTVYSKGCTSQFPSATVKYRRELIYEEKRFASAHGSSPRLNMLLWASE